MNNNYLKTVFRLALLSGIFLSLNYLFYHFTEADFENLVYSPVTVYCFFFLLSAGIIAALDFVNKSNPQQLGFAFLVVTGIKMLLSYVLARPIIEKGDAASAEKYNLVIIFIVYLVIEAYYTARLLNKKQ